MELTVRERILVLSALPQRGTLSTLRVVRELQGALSFSEAEHAEFVIQDIEGGTKWNAEKARSVDVEIGPVGRKVILRELARRDKRGELTLDLLVVCDLFGYEGDDDAAL